MNKSDIKQLKANWKNPYKEGDIFYTSYGYEQTNIDFYQCVTVKPKSIVLRAVKCEDIEDEMQNMSGKIVPVKDDFIEDESEFLARILLEYSENAYCTYKQPGLNHYVVNKKICECSSFHEYDGTPKYYSTYY